MWMTRIRFNALNEQMPLGSWSAVAELIAIRIPRRSEARKIRTAKGQNHHISHEPKNHGASRIVMVKQKKLARERRESIF